MGRTLEILTDANEHFKFFVVKRTAAQTGRDTQIHHFIQSFCSSLKIMSLTSQVYLAIVWS